jgi:hypothetical protein
MLRVLRAGLLPRTALVRTAAQPQQQLPLRRAQMPQVLRLPLLPPPPPPPPPVLMPRRVPVPSRVAAAASCLQGAAAPVTRR